MAAVTVVERPVYPECRRSWMQDYEAPTCPAWITGRAIYRAERVQLKANNELSSMHGRAAYRYWAARPQERNAQHTALTNERDAAWAEIGALLDRRSVCTCTGPDMPR